MKDGKKADSSNDRRREEKMKDPLSKNSGNDNTMKQRNNQEPNGRMESPSIDDDIYEMGGEDAADEDRNPKIVPDDPIEAEQLESEKLRFGFSFEPKEGQMGDETDDEGDLTSDQRKTGNRYKPNLGVDDGEGNEDTAVDQELHVTDTGHIGMAFGEDNYVEDDKEANKQGKKTN